MTPYYDFRKRAVTINVIYGDYNRFGLIILKNTKNYSKIRY